MSRKVRKNKTFPRQNNIIHANIQPTKIDSHANNQRSSTNKNSLLSFSSILSIRAQRLQESSLRIPNTYERSSMGIDSDITVHTSSFSRPAEKSQLNHWDNINSNDNYNPSDISNPIEQTSNQSYNTHRRFTENHFSISKKMDKSSNNPKKEKNKFFNKIFPCSCTLTCILIALLIGLLALTGAIIGTSAGVLITSQTTISSTSPTTTTTPTQRTICSCLCENESWAFDSSYLARWSFDGTYTDTKNIYNATSFNYPTFTTNGYINKALLFDGSLIESLTIPYIPLAHTSFTIEVWLKPTQFPNPTHHSILGLCPFAVSYECLHLVIRKTGSNAYLYFGFFGDDCQGNTSLTLNQWIHAAFVFDITTLTQSVYLNGILDNICTASSPIIATTGSITIGTIPMTIPIINTNFYYGYMDHLTITKRAKSSCEIHEDATLVACFLFNNPTPYDDSGPNSLQSSEFAASIISSGYSSEAMSFNGTSYFQVSSFTALGIVNKPFSLVLWIRPQSILGPILHVSAAANGEGWCVSFLGIDASGATLAQIFIAGIVSVWGPITSMSPVWSHVVQTWSSTNGLRLYVNGTLVASQATAVSYAASSVSNYITLANALNGAGYCGGGGFGLFTAASLKCDIDDFRVYSRELTASEISKTHDSR